MNPPEQNYSKREIDHILIDIRETLGRIEVQTEKTNGRVTKLEKMWLIAATIIVVLLIVNGSRFVDFVSAITK
jgi:hypothetical protein